MEHSSKQETFAERRHRYTHGKGVCHAHTILRRTPVCGKSERANGVRLCPEHAAELVKALKPSDDVWISRDRMRQLERYAEQWKQAMQETRPLREQILDLQREIVELKKLPPNKRRQRSTPAEGHVYFLQSDSAVKIGWTTDLEQRMKSYSPGAKILAVMPGTRKDETRLHRKFSHLRTNRREWFAYSPQVMEEVERIVREHGEPPRDLNEPMTTVKAVGPRLNRPTQRRARSLNK